MKCQDNQRRNSARIENSEIKKLYYGNNVVLVAILQFWLIQMKEATYVAADMV